MLTRAFIKLSSNEAKHILEMSFDHVLSSIFFSNPGSPITFNCYFSVMSFEDFIYLFLERMEGREKEK